MSRPRVRVPVHLLTLDHTPARVLCDAGFGLHSQAAAAVGSNSKRAALRLPSAHAINTRLCSPHLVPGVLRPFSSSLLGNVSSLRNGHAASRQSNTHRYSMLFLRQAGVSCAILKPATVLIACISYAPLLPAAGFPAAFAYSFPFVVSLSLYC